MGDYTIGYADSAKFPLAQALAVSAAFPGGFGPLRIDASALEWRKREWDAPLGTEESVLPVYRTLHLYDGGVYDNLGLEPFFDAGRGVAKLPEVYIVVSDAGSPLPRGFSFGSLNPKRLKRIADIMADQSHALRVRTFTHYLQQEPKRGAFIFIRTPVGGSNDDSEFASSFPTTLRKLTLDEFDRLAGHGYRVALQVEKEYGLFRRPTAPRIGRESGTTIPPVDWGGQQFEGERQVTSG